MQQIGEEDWGAMAHGGARTKKALKLEHSAVGEHAIVASALDGKTMAKVPSVIMVTSRISVCGAVPQHELARRIHGGG